ncbi:hypothetical protein AURDEDRAFT_129507 [Auricularia subglabra TFB-10046 SS5]|nr:hypothetical protein AURDEDRAFT_129507 [Auricularia subglabra TFB-10046 SS5]
MSKGLQSAWEAIPGFATEIGRAKQRVDAAAERAAVSSKALQRARDALQDFRRETFLSIANLGPAPTYERQEATLPVGSEAPAQGVPPSYVGSGAVEPETAPDGENSASPSCAAMQQTTLLEEKAPAHGDK